MLVGKWEVRVRIRSIPNQPSGCLGVVETKGDSRGLHISVWGLKYSSRIIYSEEAIFTGAMQTTRPKISSQNWNCLRWYQVCHPTNSSIRLRGKHHISDRFHLFYPFDLTFCRISINKIGSVCMVDCDGKKTQNKSRNNKEMLWF